MLFNSFGLTNKPLNKYNKVFLLLVYPDNKRFLKI